GRSTPDPRGVTNDGLRHLAGLRELESLDLTGASGVDGRGLALLKGLTRLRYLTLAAIDVGDDGLENFRELPALQFLSLTGTLITDAGLAKIRELPELRTLYLGYTKVTQEGVAELMRSCPNLNVSVKVLPEHKGRARRP